LGPAAEGWQMRFTVRPMQKDDVPQVMAIDREAFPTQWPPPPFTRDLNNRLVRYLVAVDRSGGPDQGAEALASGERGNWQALLSRLRQWFTRESPVGGSGQEETVAGYAAMWLMVDEAHLTSIAVRKTYRRMGVGELLLICMIDLAIKLKARVMTLETRVSNREAQALYRKYGFSRVGIRRRYYSDDGEDAVIMTTENLTSELYQARLRRLRQAYADRWVPASQTLPSPLPD